MTLSPPPDSQKPGSTEYAVRFSARLSIPDLPEPHVGYAAATRAIDAVGSLILLLLSAPLILLAAAWIKLDSPGTVLFRHRRLGLKGKPFLCYKFRSMAMGAYERRKEVKAALGIQGPRIKTKADPRVTRAGRFLRRFSIDEFPQLLNVLRGDMSLVGPRPLPIEELEDCSPEQIQRLAVKPGLTCTWQVSGRAEIPLEGQIQLDLEYIRKRSLGYDLCLLARTPWAVLSGRGAY